MKVEIINLTSGATLTVVESIIAAQDFIRDNELVQALDYDSRLFTAGCLGDYNSDLVTYVVSKKEVER